MAKIGWFESNSDWHELFGEMAEDEGHEIVVNTFMYFEALTAIRGLSKGDIAAAIVGSRLGGPNAGGGDGREITSQLHKMVEGVVVIGLTGDPDGVEGADFNVLKHDGVVDPMDRIAGILRELGQGAVGA